MALIEAAQDDDEFCHGTNARAAKPRVGSISPPHSSNVPHLSRKVSKPYEFEASHLGHIISAELLIFRQKHLRARHITTIYVRNASVAKAPNHEKPSRPRAKGADSTSNSSKDLRRIHRSISSVSSDAAIESAADTINGLGNLRVCLDTKCIDGPSVTLFSSESIKNTLNGTFRVPPMDERFGSSSDQCIIYLWVERGAEKVLLVQWMIHLPDLVFLASSVSLFAITCLECS